MDNGQFQIPMQERSLDPQSIQEIESAFDTRDAQEMQERMSSYEVVKNIELKIESYRANATEDTIPKQSTVDRARAAVMSLLERL